MAEQQKYPPRSLSADLFDGPKIRIIWRWFESNLLHKWGSSSVVERFNRIALCPSPFVAEEPWHIINLKPGGRMAHHNEDREELLFEITSKRRKGFPSETRVKRGTQIVHGEKELIEKLGRNDLCPCGSARRF
jgi:hypothetical protein